MPIDRGHSRTHRLNRLLSHRAAPTYPRPASAVLYLGILVQRMALTRPRHNRANTRITPDKYPPLPAAMAAKCRRSMLLSN